MSLEKYKALQNYPVRSDRQIYDPNGNYVDLRLLSNLPHISLSTIRGILQYDRSTLLAIAYIYIHTPFRFRIRNILMEDLDAIDNGELLLEKDHEIFELMKEIALVHRDTPDFEHNDLFYNIIRRFFSIRNIPLNLRLFFYNTKMNESIFSEYIDTNNLTHVHYYHIQRSYILYANYFEEAYLDLSDHHKSGMNYVYDNFMPDDPNETLETLRNKIIQGEIDFFPHLNSEQKSSSSKSMSIKDRIEISLSNHPLCIRVIQQLDHISLQQTLMKICPYITNKHAIRDVKHIFLYRKPSYNNLVIHMDENITREIDYMHHLFAVYPSLDMNIERVNYTVGVDEGGLKRQFLTNLSKQLVDDYFKKLQNNIYIFKRGLSPDEYRFIGAILLFLMRNGHGIPIRIALIDIAGLIYQPIKPRKRADIDIDIEDYGDSDKMAKHFELSDGSPKSWIDDVKKTMISYYDILLFYFIEFDINKDIKKLINKPNVSIKRVVDENILHIYEYDPYVFQKELRDMYKNVLHGMRIHNRTIFAKNKISISDLTATFSVVESTKKTVKNFLISNIRYYTDCDSISIHATKEMLNRILSMSNKTYKRLLKVWIKDDDQDDIKRTLATRLPLYEDFVKALLEFWSGTDHILIDTLNAYNVRITRNRGMLPVAHTCGLVLELSKEYSDMNELFFKFLDVILVMYSSHERFQFA